MGNESHDFSPGDPSDEAQKGPSWGNPGWLDQVAGSEDDLTQGLDPTVMKIAVEKGVARVLAPGMEPDETVYTALYVKSERGWLLDRINESAPQVVLSNYEQLKDLEWMVGTWVDQDDEATIETSVKWTKNQNFLSRSFRVSVPGEPDLSGIQLIGWDPANQEIRSWVFDSDGGFGNATWKKKDNKWIVNAAATLPDGRKSSAVRIITMVDDNTVTWQVTGRSLDGEILPNISPIKLTRNSNSE